MSHLQAVLDFSIELHKFVNVDLFQRGFYQIRVSHKVTSKIIHKIEVNYSKYSADSLGSKHHQQHSKHHHHHHHRQHHSSDRREHHHEQESNGGRPELGSSIVFPPCIVNGTAVSKTFQILYKNEEIALNDVICFKTHLILDASRCMDQVKRIPFLLTVDLWFTDQEFGPEHHSSIECVSSRQLSMHVDLCRGLHCHLPVIFDYFHLSAVTMSVHASLITLCQPYLKHHHNHSHHHHQTASSSKNPSGSLSPSFTGDVSGYDYLLFGCSLSNLKDLEWSEMQLRLRRAQLVHWQLCSIIFTSMNGLESKLMEYKSIQSTSKHHSSHKHRHRDHSHYQSSHEITGIKPNPRSMSLLAQSCYKSSLAENKSKEKSNKDFIAHQNEVMSSSSSQIPCELRPGDYITLVESDLAYLSGLSILQWEQFLKLVIHSEKIAHFLSKVYHFQRIKRFSEGFFVVEKTRHSIISVCDPSSSLFTEVSDSLRKSPYFLLLPSCDVECLPVDGDANTLPIIFEEKYDDHHHRHKKQQQQHCNFQLHPNLSSSPSASILKVSLPDETVDEKEMVNTFPKFTVSDEVQETDVSRSKSPSPIPVVSKSEQKKNLKQKFMNKLSISASSTAASSSALLSPSEKSPSPSPSPSPSGLTPATHSGRHRSSKGSVTFAFDVKTGDGPEESEFKDSSRVEESKGSCQESLPPHDQTKSEEEKDGVQTQRKSRFTVSRIPSPTRSSSPSKQSDSRTLESDTTFVVDGKTRKENTDGKQSDAVSKTKRSSSSSSGSSHHGKLPGSESMPNLMVRRRASLPPGPSVLSESSGQTTEPKTQRRSKSTSGIRRKKRSGSTSESDTFGEVFEGTSYFPKPPPEFSSPTFKDTLLDSDGTQDGTMNGKSEVVGHQRSLERKSKNKTSSLRHHEKSHFKGQEDSGSNDVSVGNRISVTPSSTESQFTFHELLQLRKCIVCEAGKSCTCNGASHLMENLEVTKESTASYTGSSSPSLRRTSAVSSRLISFLEAKEEFRREKGQGWNIYSDFPSLASRVPYFLIDPDVRGHSSSLYSQVCGVHLVVCVHGLDGNSADLRLIKTYLELGLPNTHFDFLMSQRNQGETFDCFETLTDRLVKEIVYHIEVNRLNPDKISFIGHSLGNIIIRAALARTELKAWIPKLHTFLSLSGPHLGTAYNSSGLVNMGLWVFQKWKKSASLLQLAMKDQSDVRQTFLYKLSQEPGLEHFQNILLCGSSQDNYVPIHSAHIELCLAAISDSSSSGSAYREMVTNLLEPVIKKESCRLIRFDVHHALGSNANTLIGRAAHIAVLDSELFIEKFMVVCGLKYFE